MRRPRAGESLVAAMVFAIAAGAGPAADAKPRLPDHEQAADEEATFWRELVEPRADEVAMLIRKARDALREVADVAQSDFDWAVEQRARYFVDAYHLMRYARTLSPHQLEVLEILGEAADELGKTREAIDALEAIVKLVGPDRAGPGPTSRLGAIYLRLGKLDQAVRWLRHAQVHAAEGAPIVHLAHALTARGEPTAAIEALSSALPEQRHSFSGESAIVAFALAVHYDRDEQRTAAFEMLDQLVRSMQQSFASTIKDELARLRLVGPDEHYYRALLYEAVGHYVEARAEWAHYAAFPDVAWRARALDHIARIDAQRRAKPGPRPTSQQGMPPPLIRRRLPRGP